MNDYLQIKDLFYCRRSRGTMRTLTCTSRWHCAVYFGLPSIKRATVSQQIKIILQCAQAEGRLYFDELSKEPTILRQKRKDFEKNTLIKTAAAKEHHIIEC